MCLIEVAFISMWCPGAVSVTRIVSEEFVFTSGATLNIDVNQHQCCTMLLLLLFFFLFFFMYSVPLAYASSTQWLIVSFRVLELIKIMAASNMKWLMHKDEAMKCSFLHIWVPLHFWTHISVHKHFLRALLSRNQRRKVYNSWGSALVVCLMNANIECNQLCLSITVLLRITRSSHLLNLARGELGINE